VVWKLHADNTMEPIKISLGITDHAYTQVAAVIKGEPEGGGRAHHPVGDAKESSARHIKALKNSSSETFK